MVYDLSGFRHIEDFSFGGWKEWRQNYKYRVGKRPLQTGLYERFLDVYDPSDPFVRPGEKTNIAQWYEEYLAGARAWLGPWTAEENGGEGVAIDSETIHHEGNYTYLMGIRFTDVGGPWAYKVYRLTVSRPERIGFPQTGYLRIITRTQAEEDNLAAQYAADWAAFVASKTTNNPNNLYDGYGDFELVGGIYLHEQG